MEINGYQQLFGSSKCCLCVQQKKNSYRFGFWVNYPFDCFRGISFYLTQNNRNNKDRLLSNRNSINGRADAHTLVL